MSYIAISQSSWDNEAESALNWVNEGRTTRTFRPTVVVVILDHDGRFLLVRHNTKEKNWGLIQGGIKNTEHYVEAGVREVWEESSLTPNQIAEYYPYFGRMQFGKRRNVDRGYSSGSRYVFIGLKLKEEEDISLTPAPGHRVALLDRIWCNTVDSAIEVLRNQPTIEPDTKLRVENGLIPTLKLVREAKMNGLLALLPVLSPII